MVYDSRIELILGWENFDYKDRIKSKKDLERKIADGTWSPDPPIIISPMPASYCGKFTHFLYNGNTRLSLARKHKLPLNMLTVSKEEEIPQRESTLQSLQTVLKYILSQYLREEKGVNVMWYCKNDLEILIRKFKARFG